MPRLDEDATSAEDRSRRRGRGSGPPVDALSDPEASLQHARDIAWRALNRRDRTSAELRGMLAGKRAEPHAIDQVVAELTESGYLDDAGYAHRFAEDRRRLDAWGPERIERRLAVLGVAREHIAAALSTRDGASELAGAVELLRRRLPVAPADDRGRSRALALLVRRGYDADTAYEALRRHAAS